MSFSDQIGNNYLIICKYNHSFAQAFLLLGTVPQVSDVAQRPLDSYIEPLQISS